MKFKLLKFQNVTSTNDMAEKLIRKKNKKSGFVYANKQNLVVGVGVFFNYNPPKALDRILSRDHILHDDARVRINNFSVIVT